MVAAAFFFNTARKPGRGDGATKVLRGDDAEERGGGRAGGYAAGLATGTLGFLQIYWDPNQQAIHDKIAGTVVTLDGAPKVPGRWQVAVQDMGDPTAETHGEV